MLTISSVAVSPVPPQAPTVARVQPTTPAKASDNVTPENQGVIAPVAPAGEGSRSQVVYAPSSLPPVNPTGEALRVNNFNNAAVPERIGVLPTGREASTRGRGATEEARNVGASPAQEQAVRPSSTGASQAEAQRATQNPQAQQQAAREAERQRNEQAQARESKNPALEAMDTQIKELLPNMWKASRAAVDVLIGEEARAAAAARAELLVPPKPAVTPERAAEATENYTRTSVAPDKGTQGVNLDRLA